MAMQMLLMVADAARLDAVRGDLATLGASAYTVLPVAEGHGRTGWHDASRVHPGALALVLAVDEAARAGALFDGLVRLRDARGDDVSRLFLMPVERQA